MTVLYLEPLEQNTASAAVRQYLKENKCNAILRVRLPEDVLNFLRLDAYEHDQTLSRYTCRLLISYYLAQREHGLTVSTFAEREAA